MSHIRKLLILPLLASLSATPAYAQEQALRNAHGYTFSEGEKIHISVLDEATLSQNYLIDDTGMIMLPLIGKVHVAGKTGQDIETFLKQSLQDGYIHHPIISVFAVKPKSFYIVGEIENPGHYEFSEDNMNILHAVALAGGFTRYADKEEFDIMRTRNGEKLRTEDTPLDSSIMPGDTIIVKERFFF